MFSVADMPDAIVIDVVACVKNLLQLVNVINIIRQPDSRWGLGCFGTPPYFENG